MVLKHLSLDRMASLPRYPAAQRPAHVISLDELRSSGLTVGTGSPGTPDAWLVEQDGHGYLHHPAYNLTSLERPRPPAARQHSESLNSVDRHRAWMAVALDIRELVARSQHSAGVAQSHTPGGKPRSVQSKPRQSGHSLVMAVRTTPCCGRLSEIAVRSLFGTVCEHYCVRTEPTRHCAEHDHPHGAQELVEVLPKLESLFGKVALGADVLVWGAEPILAVYAAIKLTREEVRYEDTWWLGGDWIDLQTTHALWRTGRLTADDLVALSPGADAADDASDLVDLVHQISQSHSERRTAREGYVLPTLPRQFSGSAQNPRYRLPTEVGIPQQPDTPGEVSATVPISLLEGPTDTARISTGRREQQELRRWLLAGRAAAPCALCGTTYPTRYLRAAHIKRRTRSSEAERRDVAIAMLACTFGCDQMFEHGDIFVDATGVIRSRELTDTGAESVTAAALQLAGKRCLAASPASDPYFRDHRLDHGHEL